jgi:DNA polymerase-3 subunit alpha
MFVHLHCHFTGSYSDSALRIDAAVRRAKNLGQSALAITDHGELPCAVEFYDACRQHAVRPLFGAELYFVHDAQEAIQKNNNERFHLVAIARNQRGLANLYALLSDAWLLNSFKEKRGLVDWALLEKYHEGLLLLSGCFFNPIGQAIARQGMAAGEKLYRRFKDLFGDDFFLEIGRHGIIEEEKIHAGILELALAQNTVPVLTNDVHYLEPDDWLVHDVIMKTRFERMMEFSAQSRQYWLRSEQEMRALGFPAAYADLSAAIAGRCDEVLPCAAAATPAPALTRYDVDALIAAGEAAYLAQVVPIDAAMAEQHVVDVMGKDDPRFNEVVHEITGIPRRSEPDTERIVCIPGRQLKSVIPLKRSLGKIMTQWDEAACRRAGASILPVVVSSFAEKLKRMLP